MLSYTSTLLLCILALSSSSVVATDVYGPYFAFLQSIPFTIMHRTSGLCIHPRNGSATPADNTQVVLHNGCGQYRLLFEYNSSNQTFKHVSSGYCLVPQNSHVQDDTPMVLSSQCNGDEAKFTWGLPGIQHVKSGKFIYPQGGRLNPHPNTLMTLRSRSEQDGLKYDIVHPLRPSK